MLLAAAPLIPPFHQECLLLLPLTFVHVHCCWAQTCVAVGLPVVSANNANLIQEGVGTPYVSRLEFLCFGARKSLLLLLPLWPAAGFPAAEHGDAFLFGSTVSCLVSGLRHPGPSCPCCSWGIIAAVGSSSLGAAPCPGRVILFRQGRRGLLSPLSRGQDWARVQEGAGGARGRAGFTLWLGLVAFVEGWWCGSSRGCAQCSWCQDGEGSSP